MEPLIPPPSTYPTLLFDPDLENSHSLANSLKRYGIDVRPALNSSDALQSTRGTYHRVVIVVADLANESCLLFLDSVRRATPRSWLVVANGKVDDELRTIAYRHGADALIGTPVDVHLLVERISAFQARARPWY